MAIVFSSRSPTRWILPFTFAAGVLFSLPAVAVEVEENMDWHTVMRDQDRQVQINRSAVITSSSGIRIAWARLLLSPPEAAAKGFVSVRTLNRYDCKSRTFTTVKREYLDAHLVIVRIDQPIEPLSQAILPASVDERLWREVCGVPSAARIQAAGDIKR